MRKSIVLLALLFISTPVFATTYYVRTGGGTSTQCTGTTDAVYTSGTGQPCAFNHPAWALGTYGTSGVMSGGDTLIIHHLSDSGGQAKYLIGNYMPNVNTGNCSLAYAYSCFMNPPPSGTAGNYTKIYGDNYATASGLPMGSLAQLWGDNSAQMVINLGGSSVGGSASTSWS